MLISPTINSVHGRIRSISGTDPAAGAEISETVPARRRWRILTVCFSLVTDATVVTRVVFLRYTDAINLLCQTFNTTGQLASTTHVYTFAPFGSSKITASSNEMIPFPSLTLPAGFVVETLTTGLQAGDNFGAPRLLVEEWIDPIS